MSAFRDFFHLTRDSLSIDPWRDAGVYFGSKRPQAQILERIRQDFVSARAVPKFFILGRYGAGKTHTLAHIAHELTQGDVAAEFPTNPIYLEVAPLKARDRWVTVHARVLDAIGLTALRDTVHAVVTKHGTLGDPVAAFHDADVLRFGDEALKASQAQIFRNLLFGGAQETLSWEWLKGRAANPAEAQMLSTETNLSEPGDYISALLNAAALLHAGTAQKPVLLMDEAEALGALTHPDSITEFEYAIRRLVENDNNALGFIASVQSDAGMDDAPSMLTRDDIMSRVDYQQGYIDLADLVLDANDARTFVVGVLTHLVDQEAARADLEARGMDTEPEFFPFTQDAVDQIAEFVTEDPERSSPRQIMAVLSGAVALHWSRREAGDETSPLIADQTLQDVMYPDERSEQD
jgi:hypothetical protein